MAYLKAFGAYLPERRVGNEEIAAHAGCDPEWIYSVSGIRERRFAAPGEEVADLAQRAAEDCLARAGLRAEDLGLLVLASGSAPRRFPGPAGELAARLGLHGVPALDLPMASAGSLFGLALADRMAPSCGNVLVVGAEKMSSVVMCGPADRNVTVLFGDGAGACIVSPAEGLARIVDAALHSDGAFAQDLRLEFNQPLAMNGQVVILQAARKMPAAIREVLARNGREPAALGAVLMHQANQNLIVRVARSLGIPEQRAYSNIRHYGNTSSASMLIAASEWVREHGFASGSPVVFTAFGAGFHWGALLAEA